MERKHNATYGQASPVSPKENLTDSVSKLTLSPLLCLPGEVRNRIWIFTFPHNTVIRIAYSQDPNPGTFTTGILGMLLRKQLDVGGRMTSTGDGRPYLDVSKVMTVARVCRQLDTECTSLFYGTNCFCVESTAQSVNEMSTILQHLRHSTVKMLQKVCLFYEYGFINFGTPPSHLGRICINESGKFRQAILEFHHVVEAPTLQPFDDRFSFLGAPEPTDVEFTPRWLEPILGLASVTRLAISLEDMCNPLRGLEQAQEQEARAAGREAWRVLSDLLNEFKGHGIIAEAPGYVYTTNDAH